MGWQSSFFGGFDFRAGILRILSWEAIGEYPKRHETMSLGFYIQVILIPFSLMSERR